MCVLHIYIYILLCSFLCLLIYDSICLLIDYIFLNICAVYSCM